MQFGHVGAAILALTVATAAPGAGEVRQGIDIQIRHAPIVARVDDRRLLRYELYLTNFASVPLSLSRLEVLDSANGQRVGELTGTRLQQALRPIGGPSNEGSNLLAPGRTTVAYVDLEIAGAPASLTHRLHLSDAKSGFTTDAGRAEVRNSPLQQLGPPLRGGPWVAVYDPGMDNGHRRYVYAVAGQATVPGRFAIDWFRVDQDGRQISPIGAPVLAVADGVVSSLRDDVSDPLPDAKPVRVPLADASGNFVALAIAPGRIAYYEHLKRGVAVRVGQKVRRGQVIGHVGATGQVTGPHLHFHLADRASTLGAEGLPYAFRGYSVLGRYASIDEFSRKTPWTAEARRQQAGMPGPNVVLRFSD